MEAGQIVGGHYRLDKLIGEGGMGEVWVGTHSAGHRVALKFMKGVALTMPEMHKRFIREARAASAVKHPCVVRIHEIVSDDFGAPVMVMDFLVGESMGGRLEREKPMPLGEFARLFMQVVSAVGTAHAAGIVHRDLKPDNIFILAEAKDGGEVRILDFGIAKLTALDGDAAQTAGLTSTGAMLGTPYYMSPEQVFGDRTIDHRADIWSLGVILFEALSGVKPITGDNLGQILRIITTGQVPTLERFAPQLPREILELCGRMLRVDRRERPSDLREVYEVFRKYTDVEVERFSAATVQLSAEDLAAAGITPMPLVPMQTGAPLSSTARTQPAMAARSRAPLFASIFAVAIALGAAGFVVRMANRSTESKAPPVVVQPPIESKAAAAPPVPPAIVEQAAPSVTASASASVAKPTAKTLAKPAVPSASASPSNAPAPVKSAKSLGGVASEIPF